jgi:phage gpG-like protein
MAALNLEFKVDGRTFAQAKRKLSDMRDRAGNVTAAWQVFMDWFTDGNRQQFGTQGKRWRTPWPELKPKSIAAKRRDGYTGDILIRDTTLMRSVTDRPMGRERLGPHDMEAGTRVKYAAPHHFGAPRAHLPPRPLWNVKQIKKEGAATSAVKTWIVSGRPTVKARKSR